MKPDDCVIESSQAIAARMAAIIHVIGHTLWVTPYSDGERWPAGDFPNLSAKDTGLAKWTAANRPIAATQGLGRHAHYATVFPAPRLVFLSYIAADLTLYLATTPELFLSRRLKLALSDRRFSRRQEFVDEAGKRVPIREFVVARHVRNLTALHDDKLDDLSLKIVVLAAAQGSAQRQLDCSGS